MKNTVTTINERIKGQLPVAIEPKTLSLSLHQGWPMLYNQFSDKKHEADVV